MSVKGWQSEAALKAMVSLRIRRYTKRGRLLAKSERRLVWYEIGFKDGWEHGWNLASKQNGKDKDDMPRDTRNEAPVPDPAGPAQRAGSPRKAPHHEGPAGAGAQKQSKWNKDDRDAAREKEPQKSRGPRT